MIFLITTVVAVAVIIFLVLRIRSTESTRAQKRYNINVCSEGHNKLYTSCIEYTFFPRTYRGTGTTNDFMELPKIPEEIKYVYLSAYITFSGLAWN